MKKCLLLICFLPLMGMAQLNTNTFYVNNVRAHVATNGILFNDYGNNLHGFEVPASSSVHTLFNSTLWISGLDSEGVIHAAAMTYCQGFSNSFCEYSPGPLTTDGDATTTEEVSDFYNNFWSISKSAVELHQSYYECLNNVDCDETVEFPNGYSMPPEIFFWPAQGDTDAGYSANLAPYVDYNGDGLYTPEEGDYPDICGDFAIYFIINDNGGPHLESGAAPLGVEVHTLVYAYSSPDINLNSSVFVHQDIINRSSNTYENTVFSVWSDFDIGNYTDDYIGTDVSRSMVFGYNGDDFDEANIGTPGYGSNLAAAACVILAGPYADADGEDNEIPYDGYERYGNYTTGWGDGIVDNERMGLNASMSFHTVPVESSLPATPLEFYNTQRATWKDGTLHTFGGNAYNPGEPNINSRYIYPGNSDPEFSGTDGVDPEYDHPEGWTEGAEDMPPGDRRMNASTGSFQFNPGDIQSIDYVYIFARESHDPDTDLLDILRNNAEEITAYQCDVQAGTITSTSIQKQTAIQFKIFPNPSSGQFEIESPVTERGTYAVYSTIGTLITQGHLEMGRTTVDANFLPKGIYIIRISQGSKQGVQKLVMN